MVETIQINDTVICAMWLKNRRMNDLKPEEYGALILGAFAIYKGKTRIDKIYGLMGTISMVMYIALCRCGRQNPYLA